MAVINVSVLISVLIVLVVIRHARCAVLSTCTCGQSSVSTRIVGGDNATAGAYPWTVAITDGNGAHICAGAILNSQWIVSAAQCVWNRTASNTRVSLGVHNWVNYQENLEVKEIKVHEAFTGYNSARYLQNDIALLRMTDAIVFSTTITPVCLPASWMQSFTNQVVLTSTGWGVTSYGGSFSNTLKSLDSYFVPYQQCRRYIGSNVLTSNGHVCTYSQEGDMCNGDMGSPLVYNRAGTNFLIGVGTWASANCDKRTPAGYTRVLTYLNWLTTNAYDGDYCKNTYLPSFG